MLLCSELAQFLDDYLDGKLEGETLEKFEAHLKLCPPCVQYIESYKSTIHMTHKALCECEEDEAPKEVPEALVQAILHSCTGCKGEED